MKLENFTDVQAWAVEQWEDAELGDSRWYCNSKQPISKFADNDAGVE